jgi:arylsulfatase A-like enzyme
MLICVPWFTETSRLIEGNFGHIDLVPTLLELMGQKIPEHLQGASRVPVMKGDETMENNEVFIQWNGYGDRDLGVREANLLGAVPRRSVVTADRWKLNLCAGDQGELFDLNSDPYELENLFEDPAEKDRIRMMAARIRLWQHETGDKAPLPDV